MKSFIIFRLKFFKNKIGFENQPKIDLSYNFQFHNKDSSINVADDYSMPHWINLR